MITADGTVVTLVSRDCCPYLDDPEPNYINPAVAAPREVGNSVTWDLDFITETDGISAPAESRFASDEVSAPAESRSAKNVRGYLSAPAEGPPKSRWADLLEEEDEYEGVEPIHFSDAEGVSSFLSESYYESEGEEAGATFWGPFQPFGPVREENPISRLWSLTWRSTWRRRLWSQCFLVRGWQDRPQASETHPEGHPRHLLSLVKRPPGSFRKEGRYGGRGLHRTDFQV